MSSRYVYINDRFVRAEEASLPVSDLSIQRGYGLFDYLKIVDGVPLYLEEHLDRLYYSAGQMRLPLLPQREELKDIIRQLMERNALPHSGIRITLTGGLSPDGYSIAVPNLVVSQSPLTLPSAAAFHKGIKLMTYAHQRQLPHVKTTDYIMAIWLQPQVKEQGADDILYCPGGLVGECPRANVFAVINGILVTPSENILKGVIRRQVLHLAKGLLPVEERIIKLEELKGADEVFITSTTRQVLPVRQIDDAVLFTEGPGSVTQELFARLRKQQEELIKISPVA
ncbi:MAG TPA: aminotransferase class IV [Chitinophagaceae bacterium]